MSRCIRCGSYSLYEEENVSKAVFCGVECQIDYYSARHYHMWSKCTCTINNRGPWMAKIADKTNVWQLAIPGTHDSCAYNQVLGVETQQWDLKRQLEAGIRYMDIRINPDYTIHHGGFYLGISWDNVLDYLTSFLNKYPSEIVFVRLQGKPIAWKNIDKCIFAERKSRSDSIKTSQVSLGELRGKILVLDEGTEFPYAFVNYNNLTVLDEYSVWFLPDGFPSVGVTIGDKVKHVLNALSDTKYNIIHLSGSTGMLPEDVAETCNTAVLKYIQSNKCQCIITMDFPGVELIQSIINCNTVGEFGDLKIPKMPDRN